MYICDDIAFRIIEKRDLGALRKLNNDPDTYPNLLSMSLVDEESQVLWWKSLCNSSKDKHYVICKAYDPEELIGRLRYQHIDHLHKNSEVGLDIFPEYRSKGLGKKCYKLALQYLFEQLNMHLVYLRVASFNDIAISLYKKCGFIETGVYPEFFYRNGLYHDFIVMSMLRDTYQKIYGL